MKIHTMATLSELRRAGKRYRRFAAEPGGPGRRAGVAPGV